jgi:hypothetical protein
MFGQIKKPEQPRLYWSEAKGRWEVAVSEPLPHGALRRICEWGYKMNLDRWRSMRHGDNRERLGKAIKKLQNYELTQIVTEKSFEIGFD